MLRHLVCIAAVAPAQSFFVPSALCPMAAATCKQRNMQMSLERTSRRAQFISTSAAAIAASTAVMLPAVVSAEVDKAISGVEKVPLTTTKLGGQLEPFADVSKGYRCAKPLGWNRYDGTAGEYVVKMVDLVDPTQVILITNSPVKSETELSTLGSVQEVGEKLSKGRKVELLMARERVTEGIRLYDFEFQDGDRRELKTLTVNKNKLWNLTLGCPVKAWPKREETFKTVVTSFLPRL